MHCSKTLPNKLISAPGNWPFISSNPSNHQRRPKSQPDFMSYHTHSSPKTNLLGIISKQIHNHNAFSGNRLNLLLFFILWYLSTIFFHRVFVLRRPENARICFDRNPLIRLIIYLFVYIYIYIYVTGECWLNLDGYWFCFKKKQVLHIKLYYEDTAE